MIRQQFYVACIKACHLEGRPLQHGFRLFSKTGINQNLCHVFYLCKVDSPFPLFLGDLEIRLLLDVDTPLSLMESWAEEVLPVVSLSRIILS